MTEEPKLKLNIYKPKWVRRDGGTYEYFPEDSTHFWWDDFEALKAHWTEDEKCHLLQVWTKQNPEYLFIPKGLKAYDE